ncbi:hypothetical protein [Streptomyces sp. SID8352]|uniref:hypothetical protein n=1 Tax=Streptomyces sp. SID8352 TaxID=2690338 RepID=UPI00136F1276|nr:hypothetical protein [Streptomyces sp. SID8352]MYU22927.1 hypothetical protein [Streptomyces sp. SID8352]
MSEQQPHLPPIITEPATVEACAADYAARDHAGEANTQHGTVYASAQDGIPRTTGGH